MLLVVVITGDLLNLGRDPLICEQMWQKMTLLRRILYEEYQINDQIHQIVIGNEGNLYLEIRTRHPCNGRSSTLTCM